MDSVEAFVLEFIHWLGTFSLLASILVRIVPTPEEITARWYLVAFNTLRRLSINGRWNGRDGGSNGKAA